MKCTSQCLLCLPRAARPTAPLMAVPPSLPTWKGNWLIIHKDTNHLEKQTLAVTFPGQGMSWIYCKHKWFRFWSVQFLVLPTMTDSVSGENSSSALAQELPSSATWVFLWKFPPLHSFSNRTTAQGYSGRSEIYKYILEVILWNKEKKKKATLLWNRQVWGLLCDV